MAVLDPPDTVAANHLASDTDLTAVFVDGFETMRSHPAHRAAFQETHAQQ